MKRLFGIFIPLCIFSFIAFGVSTAILGTRPREYYDYGQEESPMVVHSGEAMWEIDSPYSCIDLDVGLGSVEVVPISGTVTTFSSSTDARSIESGVSGDTLYVSVGGKEDIAAFFEKFGEALSKGFDFSDMFKTFKLTIGVPQQIYDSVYVELGTGSVMLDGIRAHENDFDIGSGSFIYRGSSDFTANSLYLDMGSGYTEMTGLPTEWYDINIGSGSFKIGDITGSGDFEMGSGSGILGFGDLNGDNDIEVSSGSLTVQVPSDAVAEVAADIGAGSVSVNACGQNVKLRDGNSIMLGEIAPNENGDELYGMIRIDIGAGSVKINNDDFTSEIKTDTAVSEVTIAEIPDGDTELSAGTAISAVTITEQEEMADSSAVLGEAITPPSPPEAPEAPTAPEPPAIPGAEAAA